MLIWFYWALAAFFPTIIVLALGIRAARLGTDAALHDLGDAGHVLGWTIPGIVVLAGLIPPMAQGWLGALRYILPLIIFAVVSSLFSTRIYLKKIGSTSRPAKSTLLMVLYGSGSKLAIAVFIFMGALSNGKAVTIEPSVLLFAKFAFAGYIGQWMLGRRCFKMAKWEHLAPCELASRVVEIGEQAGVKMREVRILRNLPLRWVGALACSDSCIGLTEELVLNLNKDEVDAVIAHEAGHCADRKYWDDSTPTAYGAILAGFTLATLAEVGIEALPSSLHWLNYVLWMCLFLVPPITWRWYSRRVERNANRYPSMLEMPRPGISAHLKLGILDSIPLSRPWWSRMLSTHPTLAEIIDKDARASGLSDEQIAEIIQKAQTELKEGTGEKYELVYQQESTEEIEKRPEKQWWPYKSIWIITMALGVVVMITLIWASGVKFLDAHLPYILAGSVVAGIVVMIAPPLIYRVIACRAVRRNITAKLKNKYAVKDGESLLLVDALFLEDWDKKRWQGALISVRDGKLQLLGEAGCLQIDLQSKIETQIRTEYTTFGLERRSILFTYEVEGLQQWFAIQLLGRAKKGQPSNLKQLERFIRNRLISAGAEMPAKPKLTRKQKMVCIKRVLIVLAFAVIVMALIAVVGPIKSWDRWLGSSVTFIFVIGFLVPALIEWIIRAPKSVKEETKETSPPDE